MVIYTAKLVSPEMFIADLPGRGCGNLSNGRKYHFQVMAG